MGELLSPVLTTVVQPTAEIGRAAVDLLLQLIDGERYLGPALLHHTLRLGGTASRTALRNTRQLSLRPSDLEPLNPSPT